MLTVFTKLEEILKKIFMETCSAFGLEIEDIPKGEIHRNLFAYAHEINKKSLLISRETRGNLFAAAHEINRNLLLSSREIGEVQKKIFMEICSFKGAKLIEICSA